MKFLFWLFIAVDAALLALVFVLGLAAAGPSHTHPLSVVAFMAVPALVLAGLVAVFLRAASPGWRIAAVLVAGAPLLIAVFGRAGGELFFRGFQDEAGNVRPFRAGPLREIEAAIGRNDAAAVAALAKGTDVNRAGLADTTVLLLALGALGKPSRPEGFGVLKALLDAGADPNKGGDQGLPLEAAIAASRHCGAEPVRMLLAAGARPNQRGAFGSPAYFLAAGAGIDPEIMKLMLAAGADPQALDEQKRNAVVTGVLTRNWRAVLLLLEKGAEWKQMRMPNGLPVREALEADARAVGDGNGLAEVRRFVAGVLP